MRRFAALVSFCVAASCTDSNFYTPPVTLEKAIDNKIAVSGSFCAEGADDLEAYLKIMFIIDRSNSMQVTDPNNRRISAVADVVNEFIEDPMTLSLRAGVEFAVISFWGDVAVHTRNSLGLPGFSNNGADVLTNVMRTADTSSNTGYDKALATAFQLLDTDMARLKDSARARSRYEVFFLSDGMPFPDNCADEQNSLPAAIGGVARIRALQALHKVPVTAHTGFASQEGMFQLSINDALMTHTCDCYGMGIPETLGLSCGTTVGDVTSKLLEEMARVGGGTFKRFRNGDAITFLDFEFAEARRLYALSSFVVSNTSARAGNDQIEADSDRDGLTDLEELMLGTLPYASDTDGDGFSDAVEARLRLSGLDPLDPTDGQCSEVDRVDTDHDGLLDCEEIFLGTLRRSMDSDADGISDWVEFQAGADPRSATPLADHQNDADADGGTNADELRWHTLPKQDDASQRASMAYDYFQTELPITEGRACYDFHVQNVALASTLGIPEVRQRGFCVAAGTPGCNSAVDCPLDDNNADGLPDLACDLTNGSCHTQDAPACLEDLDCPSDRPICDNLREQDGWNRVMLYMAQTPYDDPLAEPAYRVACVDSRFIAERDLKIPANGKVEIPAFRPSATWKPDEVYRPNNNPCHVSNNQDCGLETIWCTYDDAGVCSGCFLPPRVLGDSADGIPHPVFTNRCPACADGVDNDSDGKSDFPYDPDCFDSMDDDESPSTACKDGIDNDGNGRTDWPNDPGCDSAYDTTESAPATPPECADGIDNDGSGVFDFPKDPGCYAASDNTEALSLANTVRACNDGVDNDGDGLIDFGTGATNDPGCISADDVDEDGPSVCNYCQAFLERMPGQCDLKSGYCRARSGFLPVSGAPPTLRCTSDSQCRGARCILDAASVNFGQCVRCLADLDCDSTEGAGDGLCDKSLGSCLNLTTPVYTPTACTSPAECGGKPCDTDLGVCGVDAKYVCRSEQDCAPGSRCSEERGFCLRTQYETSQCNSEMPCAAGSTCDLETGWCLPDNEADQCVHDDECPFGDCNAGGYCDQQTFVFPEDFRPEVDCLRVY